MIIIIQDLLLKLREGSTELTIASTLQVKIVPVNAISVKFSKLTCTSLDFVSSLKKILIDFKVFILIHQSFEDISPQDLGVVPEALESDY